MPGFASKETLSVGDLFARDVKTPLMIFLQTMIAASEQEREVSLADVLLRHSKVDDENPDTDGGRRGRRSVYEVPVVSDIAVNDTCPVQFADRRHFLFAGDEMISTMFSS